MNTKIAVVLLGLLAISSASYIRQRPTVLKTAAQTPAPYRHEAAPETPATKEVEEEEYYEPAIEVKTYTPEVRTYVEKTRKQKPASTYTESDNLRVDNDRVTEEQNKNAKYAFASAIDDSIQDQSQVRHETRDGLNVKGSYSYTDGFFKRTVRYEADENGYRVVSTDVEPIGDGPQVDLVNGKADVHTQVDGVDSQYSISSDDISVLAKKVKEY